MRATKSVIKRPKSEPTYSPEFIKTIKDAEQEIKDGGGITFKSIDELKEYFKKMESDENIKLRKKGRNAPKPKRKCKCK